MKEKLPLNFLKDVIFPLAFGVSIVLAISADAYSKYGLGAAIVYVSVFGLMVAGLCYMSL